MHNLEVHSAAYLVHMVSQGGERFSTTCPGAESGEDHMTCGRAGYLVLSTYDASHGRVA